MWNWLNSPGFFFLLVVILTAAVLYALKQRKQKEAFFGIMGSASCRLYYFDSEDWENSRSRVDNRSACIRCRRCVETWSEVIGCRECCAGPVTSFS